MILYAATDSLAEVNDERFDNYEEALEAGLRKAIELIKKSKDYEEDNVLR